VFTAYSNEEAFDIHGRKKADLIITELYGSGMNAVQLCSQIREAPDLRHVSVIICCRDNEVELSQSRSSRANAVVTLPLKPAHLRHKIQELLAVPSRGGYRASFSARCARHSLHNPFDCIAENISVSGMLIETKADLMQGDRINCSLVLPPAASFEAQAEIVRAEKSNAAGDRIRYGLRFSRLDPLARRAIEVLVQNSSRF
jgi:CheY-like chemotaxis protein